MKKIFDFTFWFCAISVIVAIILDIFLVSNVIKARTISEVIDSLGHFSPASPAFIGFFMGHYFISGRKWNSFFREKTIRIISLISIGLFTIVMSITMSYYNQIQPLPFYVFLQNFPWIVFLVYFFLGGLIWNMPRKDYM